MQRLVRTALWCKAVQLHPGFVSVYSKRDAVLKADRGDLRTIWDALSNDVGGGIGGGTWCVMCNEVRVRKEEGWAGAGFGDERQRIFGEGQC